MRRDCPTVLVVSPPCTAFSIANQGEIEPQVLAGAVAMIRFSMEICELQHKAGIQFIFEQPQSSRAWSLDEVMKMTHSEGVTKTTFYQCMYCLEARDQMGSAWPTSQRQYSRTIPSWRKSCRRNAQADIVMASW